MPWHLAADLKHFKALTMGHPVIMGRKTFESILASTGKPLPGRANIVISRDAQFTAAGCTAVTSLAAALAACGDAAEAFVIGGGEIYRQALALADRLYLTEIDAEFDGDASFPEYDRALWRESSRERFAAGDAPFGYAFVVYDKAQTNHL